NHLTDSHGLCGTSRRSCQERDDHEAWACHPAFPPCDRLFSTTDLRPLRSVESEESQARDLTRTKIYTLNSIAAWALRAQHDGRSVLATWVRLSRIRPRTFAARVSSHFRRRNGGKPPGAV